MKAALAFLLIVATPALADDAALIRAARDRYNAAVASHDTAGLRAALTDDYKILSGTSGEFLAGGDAVAKSYADEEFRDPSFLSYVRIPDEIVISDNGKRAMERGHWLGRWTRSKGEQRRSGQYLAVWVPAADGWRLRSETFVTLAESGDGSLRR